MFICKGLPMLKILDNYKLFHLHNYLLVSDGYQSSQTHPAIHNYGKDHKLHSFFYSKVCF